MSSSNQKSDIPEIQEHWKLVTDPELLKHIAAEINMENNDYTGDIYAVNVDQTLYAPLAAITQGLQSLPTHLEDRVLADGKTMSNVGTLIAYSSEDFANAIIERHKELLIDQFGLQNSLFIDKDGKTYYCATKTSLAKAGFTFETLKRQKVAIPPKIKL